MNTYSNAKEFNLNRVSFKSNLLMNIFFVFYSIACIAPFILVIMVSLTDEESLLTYGYNFFPNKISISSYFYLFSEPEKILRGYGITIIVTLIGTILSLAMTALYAYPISRKTFKYRNTFSFLIFFTMLFNGGLIPWYILYTRYLHLNDTIMALIVPGILNTFNVLIMRTYFSTNIPDSIIESAKIDGASEFRTFLTIVIPLAKPVFATIGLFNTLSYWNDWWLSLIFINDNNLVSLQYLMYKVMLTINALTNGLTQSRGISGSIQNIPTESTRMAMAIVGIGPIVFAYPFFQKYFIKGLTIGAVKG